MNYAVIMAGGSGTRFWPLSRKALPKQFLTLFGGSSLLRQTYERVRSLFPDDRILVVTNSGYVNLVKAQLPEIPSKHIIGEIVGRNTAPCVAMAATYLHKQDPEAVMAVLPADHSISDEDSFLEILQIGLSSARTSSDLFTIGLKPNRPETGYGYIQYVKSDDKPICAVRTFAEKPDLETATSFLKSGDFLWNSGMFIWRADAILNQFEQYLPNLYELSVKMSDDMDLENPQEAIDTFYNSSRSISIDYGIMEKTKQVKVIPADIGWSDVGSWMAAWQLSEKDINGNSVHGQNVEMVNTRNSYVRSMGNRLIALVGMDNVVVVDTGDAILIMPAEKSQEIRELMDKHLPEHGDTYL